MGASDVAALEAEEAALGASLLAEALWPPGALGERERGGVGDGSGGAARNERQQPAVEGVEHGAPSLDPGLELGGLELSALPGEGEQLAGGGGSLPSARGPLSRAEYLHGKKRPQIGWVLQRLARWDPPPRHILDLGGGRGDLALALAQRHPCATLGSNPGAAERTPRCALTRPEPHSPLA